jgi:hypothetical protein
MTFRKGELNELFAGSERRPPTPDDVCVTTDGRRLDTPAKLIAWLEEFNATRDNEPRLRA